MKDFTEYPEVFELKQLGFDEPCMGHYSNGEFVYSSHTNNTMQRFRYAAPLYSQAFRWFREKHDLHQHIEYIRVADRYDWWVGHYMRHAKTYEEAELASLRKLIEIIRNQKTGENKDEQQH